MATRPPKPSLSPEALEKIQNAGKMGTMRGALPITPPSLVLPAILTANNPEKENSSLSQNRPSSKSKMVRPSKNNSQKKSTPIINTLREKSRVPTGSIRSSGTMRASKVPMGTFRGSTMRGLNTGTLRNNVNPLLSKSSVPGALPVAKRENINNLTLRGKSGLPSSSGAISRTKNMPSNENEDAIPRNNKPAATMDFGDEDEEDFNSTPLVSGLEPAIMDFPDTNNDNADFDPDMSEINELGGFDPSAYPDMGDMDPSLYSDPNGMGNAPIKPSGFDFDPNQMPMDDNLFCVTSNVMAEEYEEFEEFESGTATIGVTKEKEDKKTVAKAALTSAGKVALKRASVVAEKAGAIENSKVRSYIKKTLESVAANDPTLTVVSLASCRLTRPKLKELNTCLEKNTVSKKLDLSNKGFYNAESCMSALTKGLANNQNITAVDVANTGCGLKAALAIEKLLKVNLNITRFNIQERVFQANNRALLAHTLSTIQWLLNSNYSYQAFKYGKSTDLVLSGRNYKQLVSRLLEGAERVQYFDISYNELETFPIMIEEMAQVQQFIANHNKLSEIPGAAIVNFDRLMKLDLSYNNLTHLPDELCDLVNVQEFQCSNNMIEELPEMFRLMQSLKRVDISNNKVTKLPQELSNLGHLEIFLVNQNLLTEIPDSLMFISTLRVLNLSHNKLTFLPEETPNLPCLEDLNLSNNLITTLPDYIGAWGMMRRLDLSFNKLTVLPDEFTQMKNMELLDLNTNVLVSLPEGFGNLWRLTELYCQNNKLTALPKTLQLLKYLKVLDLCNNRLKILDHFLCTLVSLHTLRLYKNEPLKGMPSEILEKAEKYEKSEKEEKREEGAQMTLNLVKQLPKVPISVSRIKLMIVGKEGVGKSCLYESFKMKYAKERLKGKKVFETEPTEGIRTMNMKFKDITFHTWDFSGNENYYSTHQLFLSEQAIYLLVCNMMDSESEDVRIERWLELITRKVNDQVPIIIVGTHLDDKACKSKVRKTFWTRIKALGARFPNIIGYEGISAKFNKKTDVVLERVIKVAEKQSYIPRQVMRGYQYLEERIDLLNGLMQTPMTTFKRFSEEVIACGVAPDAVKDAMKYLHDAGIIVYFGDVCPMLVFLDPQWIVDLISSYHHIKQYAKRGLVNRSEFENIWNPKKYPTKYHEYILMLLEKFDMLMRLKEQGKIFFPELLEEEATPSLATLNMMWAPGYEMEEPEFRRNLEYTFIPNTLFPRVVGKIMHVLGWKAQNYWKNGSILEKDNGSTSFIKLTPLEKTIHLTVRGEHAGDDILLILDTIQSLNKSLHLTDVDTFVPCTHCLLLEEDAVPYMFPISVFDAAFAESRDSVMCREEVPVRLRALLPKTQIAAGGV